MALKIQTIDRVCLILIVAGSIALSYWTLNWTFKQRRLLNQENELYCQKFERSG